MRVQYILISPLAVPRAYVFILSSFFCSPVSYSILSINFSRKNRTECQIDHVDWIKLVVVVVVAIFVQYALCFFLLFICSKNMENLL